MMRRFGQLLNALVAAAATLTLLVGVPAALVTWVGWPLPTSWPTLGELARVVEVGISDAAIIKTLAVIVWVTWAQLALALVVETAAVVRQRTARALPLLPGLQPLAAQLIAAMLLAAVTTQPRVEAAAAPLELTLASDPTTITTPTTPDDHRENGATREPAAATPAAPATATATVTTGERASWWQLAEDHLGDGLRWRELRDLNLDRTVGNGTRITTTTEQLEPGWQLLVPADTTPGRPPGGDHTMDDDGDQPPADDQRTEAERTAEAWTIEPGDHFWAIAETSLSETWGRTPTEAETTGYWQELVETNRDRLAPPHDPDLIYPDEQFKLPTVPDDPATDTDSAPDGAAEETDEATRKPEPPAEPAPSDETASEESDTQSPDAIPDAGLDEPTGDHDPAGTSPTRPAPDGDVGPGHEPSPRTQAPAGSDSAGEETSTAWGVPASLTAGLAGSTLLAAGIMALLRRRRRAALQQRTAGLRLPTPAPETVEHIAGIEAADPPQRRLDDLIALLESIPADVHPVLVTTQDDGTVTLLFDDTTPGPPPPPWQPAEDDADGPLRWTAQLGTWGPTRSIGLPLLVTLGRTEQTTVLANLHAMRQLTVDGAEPEVRRRLRAYALEVATTRILSPVRVAVAGDQRLASLEELQLVDDPADEIAAALAEHTQQVVHDDRLPRLLVCHHGAAPPAVPDELDVLVGLARAGPRDGDGWHLDLEDTRGRLWLPAGTTVELTLPAADPDLVDDELTRLETDIDPRTSDATAPTAPKVEPRNNGHPPRAAAKPVEPAWCEIRLLGPVEIVRDGQPVTDITPLCLQVLAYLATHRHGVTGEQLENAVWAGRAARADSQRIRGVLSRLRHTLGDGPDRQPLIPPRHAGSKLIRLTEHLGCDLDRAFAHLATARDLDGDHRTSELIAALDLVRGEPFEGLPVSWATDVQQRAITQLQDAALEAAAALRKAGEYDKAEDAIRRGLQLCDPAEPLYIEWAHLETARGRRDQVPRLWQRLRNRYAQDADETAGWVATPTAETELAFQTFMSPG